MCLVLLLVYWYLSDILYVWFCVYLVSMWYCSMSVYITDFHFQSATVAIYKDIWENFDPEVGYISSVDEGMDKVSVLPPKCENWIYLCSTGAVLSTLYDNHVIKVERSRSQ